MLDRGEDKLGGAAVKWLCLFTLCRLVVVGTIGLWLGIFGLPTVEVRAFEIERPSAFGAQTEAVRMQRSHLIPITYSSLKHESLGVFLDVSGAALGSPDFSLKPGIHLFPDINNFVPFPMSFYREAAWGNSQGKKQYPLL
jgi:hypothetical protein